MNVRSSRSHTIFRMVCCQLPGMLQGPIITFLPFTKFIFNYAIFVTQVIESKRKDTGSGDNSSSDDAIRVSVLVCEFSELKNSIVVLSYL